MNSCLCLLPFDVYIRARTHPHIQRSTTLHAHPLHETDTQDHGTIDQSSCVCKHMKVCLWPWYLPGYSGHTLHNAIQLIWNAACFARHMSGYSSHTLHFHPSFLSTRLPANIIRKTHPHATRTAQHMWGAAVITLCVLNIYCSYIRISASPCSSWGDQAVRHYGLSK